MLRYLFIFILLAASLLIKASAKGAIMQNNVNIIIKDSSNNIIQSTSITLSPNQPTAIKIVTIIKGDYRIELRYSQVSLYGYFSIMS